MSKKKEISLPYIIFETTSNCNLNCKYCYNIWKIPNSVQKPFNSYKMAKRTLRKLFKLTDVKYVTMSGGEPFLSERFAEIVLYCRMKGKDVIIISNGNAGNYEDYKLMRQLGVNLFEFPFHSNKPEVHDYLAGVIGAWEKSLRSIHDVLDLGSTAVAVIVITKVNYGHIKETLLYLYDIGIRRVMLNRFNIGGMGIKEKENILLNISEMRQAFKTADEIAQKYPLSITSNVCTPFCILNPDDYKKIRITSCAANVINMPLTLDINGNLRLCNHSPVIVGNIYKDRLADIFNSQYAKTWKETVPTFCKDCEKYPKCLGGCRAASEQLGLSVKEVDPIVTFFKDCL